jgi:hypothetical protein
MATTYTTITEHNRFKNGEDRGEGTYGVGYNGAPLVIRYTFTTPSDGATKITIEKKSCKASGIGNNEKIMFFISPSDNTHTNACYVEGAPSNPQYDGIFTFSDDPDDKSYGYQMATGIVEKVLLPSTTYYLFFFPAFNSEGWYDVYNANKITLTLEGVTGIVRIDAGNEFITAIPYIDNGTEWKQAIPYNDNGADWNICG